METLDIRLRRKHGTTIQFDDNGDVLGSVNTPLTLFSLIIETDNLDYALNV